MRNTLILAIGLSMAAEAAQDVPYGARVDVDSFAYRRAIPAGSPGLTELPLDAAVLAHTRSGFADLRIVSSDGRQVPYLIERDAEPLSMSLPALAKGPSSSSRIGGHYSPSGRQTGTVSRYILRLPYAHLPAARLVFATPARVFERELWLEASPGDHDNALDADWKVIVADWWSHTDPETPAPALTFDVPELNTAILHLAVDEGDNAPLPLERPTLLLPAYRVRFVRPSAAPLRLIYGNRDVEPPRYDLALAARRLRESPAALATADPEPPRAAPRLAPGAVFWSALALAVVALFALIVRLLRKAPA